MVFNKAQTTFEDAIHTLNKEQEADLIEILTTSIFVANMVSHKRKYTKDLKRDEEGKVVVDLENPHILEDMDYFRQRAIYFQKNGVYTHLHPNTHPHSEYSKFWKEEIRRCLDGYVRESDGEWIPGDYYWYLNYCPIPKTVKHKGKKHRADRISDFPDVYDGDYLFFHYVEQARDLGHHGSILKARGKGFSLKNAAQIAKRFILGDTLEARKQIKSYAIANEREYLTKDGVLNKFKDIIDFCSTSTPFPRLKLKESWNTMYWKMGYVDTETDTDKGNLNEVFGVTLKNDPDRARGKRGSYIYWEEMGKFPDFLKAWQVARPSVEQDGTAFGFMLAAGTGGADDADFHGANEIFYNPRGYNVYAMNNVFDKNTKPGAECSFFFPDYMNVLDCYDNNGNSDVVSALVFIVKKRHLTKYNTSDPNAIVQLKAEHPIYPQEAIMRKEGSVFPIYDLKERLAEIKPQKESFIAEHYVGRIIASSNGLKWENDLSMRVLREFPTPRGIDTTGGIEIFYHPVKNSPRFRYIMGVDPVDSDAGTSLASAFVFDTFTHKIVAEYTARPRFANDFYKTTLRLAEYYNAIINYENNIKGFYTYAYQNNKVHHLCNNPQILKDMGLQKGTKYGNQSKGTRATNEVNSYARRLQRDWMLSPAIESEEENPLMNLQTIRSIAYLEEASQWNPDGNFDRVSAMGMVMILWEDIRKYSDRLQDGGTTNSFANSAFFKANYSYAKQKAKKDYFESLKKGELAINDPKIFSDFTGNLSEE